MPGRHQLRKWGGKGTTRPMIPCAGPGSIHVNFAWYPTHFRLRISVRDIMHNGWKKLTPIRFQQYLPEFSILTLHPPQVLSIKVGILLLEVF